MSSTPLLPRPCPEPVASLGIMPFDVELAIAEFLLGDQLAGARDDFEVAVLHLPLGLLGWPPRPPWTHLERSLPSKSTMASEGGAWTIMGAGVTLGGARALHVVDLPLLVGQLRRVVVAACVVAVGGGYAVARRRGCFAAGRGLRDSAVAANSRIAIFIVRNAECIANSLQPLASALARFSSARM